MNFLGRLETWWRWLSSDPVGFLIYFSCFAVGLLLTLILHEVAHGYVAYRCGDPTAKMLGRLSLNPARHLDPFGTLCMILLGFGWAKPVPVNPRNFQNYRRDDFLVSIAGVTVNLTLFLLSLALAVGFNAILWKEAVLTAFGARNLLTSSGIGYELLFFADRGQVSELMNYPWLQHLQRFLLLFSTMNLSVAVFNLLPIPPLDGFHVLNDTILKGRLSLNPQVFQMTRMILLLLLFTGALSSLLSTIIGAVEASVLNVFLLMTGQA